MMRSPLAPGLVRSPSDQAAGIGLPALGLLLAAVGIGLYVIGGSPYVPNSVPDAGVIGAALRSPEVPLAAFGYLLIDAAWLVWAWLVLSVLLRVVVDLAEGATRGARWVASLRLISDRVTLPIVRRAVDGALAAVLVANVALRAVPVAAAEPLATAPATSVVAPVETTVVPRPAPATDALHVVRAGENLWSLAERYYGSGREYPRIVEANLGRGMAGGQTFSRAGVIVPGWSLRVPLPSERVEQVDGSYWYTVEAGDTLWGISGRLLGDETRWPELFDANRETAYLADGRVLNNPDLIWPQLRLRLPVPLADAEPVADVVAADAAPRAPASSPAVPAPDQPDQQVDHRPANGDVNGTAVAAATGAGALATAAVAGVVFARRRGRRDLLEFSPGVEPETSVPIRGGFAEFDLARELAQNSPVTPAAAVAGHVTRLLQERGLDDAARLVAVSAGRVRSSVVLEVPAESRTAVRALAPALSARLGAPVRADLSRDQDVVFELGAASLGTDDQGPELLRTVVLLDRRELWLNAAQMGHVLVASLPGEGADVVLSSLVASLAAQRAPGSMRLWTVAAPGELPTVLDGLPQLVKARADSRNSLQFESALRDVRAELIRRMQGAGDDGPEIVLLLGELAAIDYEAHRTSLDMLGTYGPTHGVRLLAATRESAGVTDNLLRYFSTRFVLRTSSAEESERLLGQHDAADLVGGGQLVVRVGQRRGQEAYGVRIRPDVLERLIRLLRARHGLTPWAGAADDSPPGRVAAPELIRLEDVDATSTSTELVQVRCFGGFEVRGPAGELVPTVDELGRDAAWDVLAVLAASSEGAIGTAELLERVWPGVESHVAEDLLKASRTSRRVLLARATDGTNAEIVRFAPGETCHLDTRLVVSDVQRFLRLCRAAPHMPPDQARLAWQRARGLYAGALLDGAGARAWPWASRPDPASGGPSPRDRYRTLALQATQALARLAAADGRLDDAVRFYQEILAVEPTLEDVVREVCACYLQLADTDAVVRTEVRLRAALEAAYAAAGPGENPLAYEPESATVEVFEQARRNAERHSGVAVAVG